MNGEVKVESAVAKTSYYNNDMIIMIMIWLQYDVIKKVYVNIL